jgi:hypothetical protein
MPIDAREIRDTLAAFGARGDQVVWLSDASPDARIRYLDLLRGSRVRPVAVVEVERQPLLYVMTPPDPATRTLDGDTRRELAFRAGADHVAVIDGPGRLKLYRLSPPKTPDLPDDGKVLSADLGGAAATLVPSLALPQTRADGKPPASVAVHDLLLRLLGETKDALLASKKIGEQEALALVGRALFVRFLLDRGVLSDSVVRGFAGETGADCFSHPAAAAKTSRWLDTKFNGDFLPLPQQGSEAWFASLDKQCLNKLGNILQRNEPSGQRFLEWGGQWNDLLFDRIPVGLLSQVYEQHAHTYDRAVAKVTGVRYTPRHVAEYMVDHVVRALGPRARTARFLDPAVGGGVFLIAVFRRLAAAHWEATGKPPATPKLREILYNQLSGFDISEAALKLCSLGLYLTAIELDEAAGADTDLRFEKPLLRSVLHPVGSASPRKAFLGSLAQSPVGSEHQGPYDVVIGNPPWNTWTPTGKVTQEDVASQVAEVTTTIKPIVRKRAGEVAADRYEMIDNLPDLPFFWRATEWAKPEDGYIALAMHGRLLFKTSGAGRHAREDLFRAVRVTGILNGSALRRTRFWPKVEAHFCIVFARNTASSETSAFYFVSPEEETALNAYGRMRVDPDSVGPVTVAEITSQPALLKTLSTGTFLDVEVVRKIQRRAPKTLWDYWEGKGWKKKCCGQGFKVQGKAKGAGSTTPATEPATELWKLPMLTELPATGSRLIDHDRLAKMPEGKELHRPRKRSIYKKPLVLFYKSPDIFAQRTVAYLAWEDVAYNELFTGFSCAESLEPDLLARYLLLLLNTQIVLYCALTASSQLGAERDVLKVDDVKSLPFVPLEELAPTLREDITRLSNHLLDGSISPGHPEIEKWVSEVYGLSAIDVEVIRDTLAVGLRFGPNRERAAGRPTPKSIEVFRERIATEIQPFLTRFGRLVEVSLVAKAASAPWVVLRVESMPEGRKRRSRWPELDWGKIISRADSLAASQIIVKETPSTLLVAVLAQGRYFTPSRARLLALQLVHVESTLLLGGEDV